jgi:hypothetical protein
VLLYIYPSQHEGPETEYGVLNCNGHLRKVVVELMALASATRRASVVTPPFGGFRLSVVAE